MDVEPVREEQRRARLEIRRNLVLVQSRLRAVRHEEHDELRAAHRLGDGRHREPGLFGGGPRLAALAEADHDVDAGVRHVQRMRVTLAAVAEHGDLAVEEIDVSLLVDLCHAFSSFRRRFPVRGSGRLRPTRPVRTSSRTP